MKDRGNIKLPRPAAVESPSSRLPNGRGLADAESLYVKGPLNDFVQLTENLVVGKGVVGISSSKVSRQHVRFETLPDSGNKSWGVVQVPTARNKARRTALRNERD